MAKAGVIDPFFPPDPNRRIDIPSDFTIPETLDPPSLFAGLGFDDEDGDFNFNLDDLSLPSDTEPFVVGDFDFLDEPKESVLVAGDQIDFGIGMDSNSAVSVDRECVDVCDKNIYSECYEVNNASDVSFGDEKLVQFQGLFDEGVNDDSPSYERNGPASSHGSGSCGVGCEALNYSSPEQVSSCDKNVLSNVVDCEMEKEVLGKRSLSKRKKESGEGKIEPRSNRLRRSCENRDVCVSSGNEDDEKRKARMMRNRESAQLSRQRKKQYVEELEDKIRMMHSTITDLNGRISYIMAENTSLRQQLGGGGMYPPPPGMYPPNHVAHMPYPWMGYPPYAIHPQGSTVPLVPIPRLKPRQPSKSKNSTKKVASISLLGLLFFIFLFGALVPWMNIRYEGTGAHIHNHHRDRILTINGHRDGSDFMIAPASNHRPSIHGNHLHHEKSHSGEKEDTLFGESQRHLKSENSSEPLLVSLYVPRNDKLLKIDGNLIIHSFLASEKAMASYMTSENMNGEKLGTALVSHSSPRLTYSETMDDKDGRPNERRRALGSGTENISPTHGKATLGEGKLHQWFQEGLSGPMLPSGMCTEVLSFDLSPMANPGAIVPASSMANSSADPQYNTTNIRQRRNRRALNSLPMPDNKSTPNDTEGYLGKDSQGDLLQGNKTPSSMVVSILADPREVGDLENLNEPKTFSRIFVVVLLDSVKYVTYSCMIPIRGSGSQVVAS
ncbi:unnamed protein product [Rhodiola kirilowii]